MTDVKELLLKIFGMSIGLIMIYVGLTVRFVRYYSRYGMDLISGGIVVLGVMFLFGSIMLHTENTSLKRKKRNKGAIITVLNEK